MSAEKIKNDDETRVGAADSKRWARQELGSAFDKRRLRQPGPLGQQTKDWIGPPDQQLSAACRCADPIARRDALCATDKIRPDKYN